MAIIKKKQLKQMNDSELSTRLSELRLEMAKERGQIAIGGTPSNPGRIKEIKRTIARILTQIKMKREVK